MFSTHPLGAEEGGTGGLPALISRETPPRGDAVAILPSPAVGSPSSSRLPGGAMIPGSPHRVVPPIEGKQGVGGRGGGGRRRYGTDPMHVHPTAAPAKPSWSRGDPGAVAAAAAVTLQHSGATEKSPAVYREGTHTIHQNHPRGVPQRPCSRPGDIPAGVATTSPVSNTCPSAVVLLRHSHGGITRVLYADGRVETTAVSSKGQWRPSSTRNRGTTGTARRSHLPGKGDGTVLPPSGSLAAQSASGKATATPRENGQKQWHLHSYDGVAQVHAMSLPALPDTIEPPTWGNKGAGGAGAVVTADVSRRTSRVVRKDRGSTSQEAERSEATGDLSAFSPEFEGKAMTVVPSSVDLTQPSPPERISSEVVLPPLPTMQLSRASKGMRCRRSACDAADEASEANEATAVFLTSVAADRDGSVSSSACLEADLSCKGTSAGITGAPSKSSFATFPEAAQEMHINISGEGASSEGVEEESLLLANLQYGIRVELAKEQRASARLYAQRYNRDLAASPSIFSLRFPFKTLSELHAFEDRTDGEARAATTSPSTSSHHLDLGQVSGNFLGHQGHASDALNAAAAVHRGAGDNAGQPPDVLLPEAQTTMPCGFTVPELLRDCLLPRESQAWQYKLSELSTFRGVVDAADTVATRFTVSFVWFTLLRCRKTHREQSLVDGYRRLSRAFADAFPNVPAGETLPPLDVLEQILVEVLTCMRYVKHWQETTNAEKAGDAHPIAEPPRQEDRSGAAPVPPMSPDGPAAAAVPVDSSSSLVAPLQPKDRSKATASSDTTGPTKAPVRSRMKRHRHLFPLLLGSTWSRLIDAAPYGARVENPPTAASTASQPRSLAAARAVREGSAALQQIACTYEDVIVLPSQEAFHVLRKVYHDLWLYHAEYVQLCLFEELLYKQLAMLFGTFVMQPSLATGGDAKGSSPAVAAASTLDASAATASMSVITGASHVTVTAGAELDSLLPPVLRTSAASATDPSATVTGTAAPSATPSTFGSNAVASAAPSVPPGARDGILDSVLLLVAHATYYNCVFCFPNDFHAGLFDEDFRADVVRWLSFCCHGVVLTHVQVRRWPMPAKRDYAAAQEKHKAAVEQELMALGLLQPPPVEEAVAAPPRILATSSASGSRAVAEGGGRSVSTFFSTDEDSFSMGDVAANSESRLAYQLDRYSRSAALHVAELERCMARLQRRHVRGPAGGGGVSGVGGGGAAYQRRQRLNGGACRSSGSSKRNSLVSIALNQSVGNRASSNLSDLVEATGGGRQTPPLGLSGQVEHASHAATLPPKVRRGKTMSTSISLSTPSPKQRAAGRFSLTPLPIEDGGMANSTASNVSPTYSERADVSVPPGRGSGGTREPRMPKRHRRRRRGSAAQRASHGGPEDIRSQLPTSASPLLEKSLVVMAAELSRGSLTAATSRAPAIATGPLAPGKHPTSPDGNSSGGDGSGEDGLGGSPEMPSALQRDDTRKAGLAVNTRRHHRASVASLLSSYPLCTCPPAMSEYWLGMLLRVSYWWTPRTALTTAMVVIGAAAARSPAALCHQSAQLVLWACAPLDTEGAAVPPKEVCRLQLEPWRPLFSGTVVIPPISEEAQLAAPKVRVYRTTLPRQQARFYRAAESQLLQQRLMWQDYDWKRDGPPPIRLGGGAAVPNARAKTVTTLPELCSSPGDLVPSQKSFLLSPVDSQVGITAPAGAALVTPPSAIPAAATQMQESGGTDIDAAAAAAVAVAAVPRFGTALLPIVPPIAAKDVVALRTVSSTAMPGAASATTAVTGAFGSLGANNIKRYGIGKSYQGSTSPFFLWYSTSLSARSPSLPPRSTSPWESHPSLAGWPLHTPRGGSVKGRPDSVEAATPDATSLAASHEASTFWGPSVSLGAALPASGHASPAYGAPDYRTSPQNNTASTGVNAGALLGSSVQRSDTVSSGGRSRSRHFKGPHASQSFSGAGDADDARPKHRRGQQKNAFSITAVPREEANLRPRRLGPLKSEALRRCALLLGDMHIISERDRVARQSYVVQHLQIANAMAHTQSEFMMRRYCLQGRHALERLLISDAGTDGAPAQNAAPAAVRRTE